VGRQPRTRRIEPVHALSPDYPDAKSKVDYKEILSPEDFTLFSKLRETRKKLAEDSGQPVYAVCTNEQLAEIAKQKPKTAAECTKIEGIGQGKAEKFVPTLIAVVHSPADTII
jgi:superfamily II DNA helicase RecQ